MLHSQAMADQGGNPLIVPFPADFVYLADYPVEHAYVYVDRLSSGTPAQRVAGILDLNPSCNAFNLPSFVHFGYRVVGDYLTIMLAYPLPGSAAQDLLTRINAVRAVPRSCGGPGSFGPSGPLQLLPSLVTVTQAQADRMLSIGEVSDEDADGRDTLTRVAEDAGYAWDLQVTAFGRFTTASVLVNALFADADRPDLCEAFMDPDLTDLGVGRAGTYWELFVGRPALD